MRISLATRQRRAVAGVAVALAGAILLGAGAPMAWSTPAALDLGAAASFAVLAGGGVRDTGRSAISGDVGTHPLPAIPDLLDSEATGMVDRAGAKSRRAQQDLARALATVANLRHDRTVSLADNQSLAPGVYAVTDAEHGLAASLTLDGHGAVNPVWIFVVPTDLVTAPGSTVTMVNGAQACNVFWSVGGSVTLAAGSTFAGSILAMTSVTVGAGVTVSGRILARTAAVVLGGDRISVPACLASASRSAPRPTAVGVLAVSAHGPSVVAGTRPALPAYLPIVMLAMLVAAVILGEPRHRYRRRAERRRW